MSPIQKRKSAVRRRYPRPLPAVIACVAVLMPVPAMPAAEIGVTVLDKDGQPVPNVAVYVSGTGNNRGVAAAGTRAVMDQVDVQFVPHILVVQTGTSVEFPNSDTVAHHVYSFSHPNHFKLPIYRGDAHPPVTFDHSGVITLGCNIHDNMLGFILVVDTDRFSKTNLGGMAVLPVDGADEVEIGIWSPRVRDEAGNLSQTVQIRGVDDPQLVFRLRKQLRPAHDQHSDAFTWSEY